MHKINPDTKFYSREVNTSATASKMET
jgi:hypothetical protein